VDAEQDGVGYGEGEQAASAARAALTTVLEAELTMKISFRSSWSDSLA
jgi:hypothetical protein